MAAFVLAGLCQPVRMFLRQRFSALRLGRLAIVGVLGTCLGVAMALCVAVAQTTPAVGQTTRDMHTLPPFARPQMDDETYLRNKLPETFEPDDANPAGTRIVGGFPARPGAWPSMVGLTIVKQGKPY